MSSQAVPRQMETGIVQLESAVEARRSPVQRIKNQRANKGSGVIALRVQEIGQIRKPRRERDAEIVDVIELRISPSQYRRVRCGGDWYVRVGARERYSLRSHRIEIWS